MDARFKLRRYQVLAERSQILATAAEGSVFDLLTLARDQQSEQLLALAECYRRAIDDVKRGIRSGDNLPPLLFRLDAIGREVVGTLASMQRSLIAKTAIAKTGGHAADPAEDCSSKAAIQKS